MGNLFWLTQAQVARLRPFFPKSHGVARFDYRRGLSGIIFIDRNGLRWCDAPKEHGPPKTIYDRWRRWRNTGVFARFMAGLASETAVTKAVMINATYLKAHRTATSPRSKKGVRRPAGPIDRPYQGRHEHEAARGDRCPKVSYPPSLSQPQSCSGCEKRTSPDPEYRAGNLCRSLWYSFLPLGSTQLFGFCRA